VRLLIDTRLAYQTAQPCDLLLQIEALKDAQQCVTRARLEFDAHSTHRSIPGEEGLGTRAWVKAGAAFECRYRAQVEVTRSRAVLRHMQATAWADIPGDVVKYLMPSRYCHPELFLDFVNAQFGAQAGGVQVAAMRDWIAQRFTYDPAASDAGTTATDSFHKLAGVCRDYAHVLITFARAAGVPARFVSCYAPDVTPKDFHAVVEVFLDGAWHLVDATGMAQADETVRICVGRDAADASFMTSYGWMEMRAQSVTVTRAP